MEFKKKIITSSTNVQIQFISAKVNAPTLIVLLSDIPFFFFGVNPVRWPPRFGNGAGQNEEFEALRRTHK